MICILNLKRKRESLLSSFYLIKDLIHYKSDNQHKFYHESEIDIQFKTSFKLY